MAKEKYDVFISYSSQDQKVAEGIWGFLEAPLNYYSFNGQSFYCECELTQEI